MVLCDPGQVNLPLWASISVSLFLFPPHPKSVIESCLPHLPTQGTRLHMQKSLSCGRGSLPLSHMPPLIASAPPRPQRAQPPSPSSLGLSEAQGHLGLCPAVAPGLPPGGPPACKPDDSVKGEEGAGGGRGGRMMGETQRLRKAHTWRDQHEERKEKEGGRSEGR